MLLRLFSYRGDLGRCGFLAGLLAVWAPLLALFWIIGTYSDRWDEAQSTAIFLGCIALVVLHVTAVLGLQTRRLRSLGAPAPLLIALGVFGFSVIDLLALARMPGLAPPIPGFALSPLGWTAQAGLHLALLLWPPRPVRPADVADAFS